MPTPEEQQAINEAAARARGGHYAPPAARGAVSMPEPRNIPGQVRQGFALAGPQPPDPALVDSLVGRIAAQPAPAAAAAAPDTSLHTPYMPGEYAPAPAKTVVAGSGPTKGAPAAASVQETKQDTLTFMPYASKNPESAYDRDIEFTHTLSRMLGMAGLGDKAVGVRDLHMKMQMARMDDIGQQAQRAFIAGDVTKGIDMFNHAVPNGQKIVAYSKGPDGKTYSFKMEDGTEVSKTADELASTITMFRNPAMLATMMTNRAKALAEAQGRMGVEQFKGQMSLQQAIATKLLDQQGQIALERLKQAGEKPTVYQQVGGDVYISTAGGRVYKRVDGKDKNNNPITQWVPAQLPGAQTSGYAVDMGRLSALGM
jgi:hypothetical protein